MGSNVREMVDSGQCLGFQSQMVRNPANQSPIEALLGNTVDSEIRQKRCHLARTNLGHSSQPISRHDSSIYVVSSHFVLVERSI